MSWQSCPDPARGEMPAAASIETVIVPRAKDTSTPQIRCNQG
jgi:hypothetical protein